MNRGMPLAEKGGGGIRVSARFRPDVTFAIDTSARYAGNELLCHAVEALACCIGSNNRRSLGCIVDDPQVPTFAAQTVVASTRVIGSCVIVLLL